MFEILKHNSLLYSQISFTHKNNCIRIVKYILAIYLFLYELSFAAPFKKLRTNSLHNGSFCMIFVACCFFSKLTFSKNSFRNTIRVSNSMDQYQAQHFVGLNLGQHHLQKLSAEDTCRHIVRFSFQFKIPFLAFLAK